METKTLTHPLYVLFDYFGLLSEAEIALIITHFKPKSYKRGTILVNFGEINDKLYFIEQGMLREFSEQEQEQEQDNTVTHWLMPENNFEYIVDSFLDNKPSEAALEAIEDVKLWEIKKVDIEKLYQTIPWLGLIGKLMTEQYLKKYEAFVRMLRLSTEERVEWYYSYHKELANRVPLNYLATYLQMTPSTLSKIRKKMASKKSKS